MERGELAWIYLHMLKEKYPKPDTRMGYEHPKVEEWLASLSDADFAAMIQLNIGFMTRVHYCKVRDRVKNDDKKKRTL